MIEKEIYEFEDYPIDPMNPIGIIKSTDDFVIPEDACVMTFETLPAKAKFIESDTWVITNTHGDDDDFHKLRNLLDTLPESNIRSIVLIFTKLKYLLDFAFSSKDYVCNKLTSIIALKASHIGKYAFNNCISLKDVRLPNAITIEVYAFGNCNSLEYVSFPNAITIGDNAFCNCNTLKNVSLPHAISIGNDAFCSFVKHEGYSKFLDSPTCHYTYKNRSLTTILLPVVQTIGKNAFIGCHSLFEISLPNAILIQENAFKDCCSLSTISLPNAITIKHGAFDRCNSLTTICLPNVRNIGSYAFWHCDSLLEISIPYNTNIESWNFEGKSITINRQ